MLFFATLNFNHKVLYAPSDYRSNEGFSRTFRSSTPEEKQQKVEREAEEGISEGSLPSADRAKFVESYREAELLVRQALVQEYGQCVHWDVVLSPGLVVDGVIDRPEGPMVVEIKAFPRPVFRPQMIRQLNEYSRIIGGGAMLVAVALFDQGEGVLKNFEEKLTHATKDRELPVTLRVYTLRELRRKFP